MSQASLRRHLEALRRELDETPSMDADSRARLDRVAEEIDAVLGTAAPDYGPLRDRIADATLRFEADHPRFARVLSDVTDTLAKLGI